MTAPRNWDREIPIGSLWKSPRSRVTWRAERHTRKWLGWGGVDGRVPVYRPMVLLSSTRTPGSTTRVHPEVILREYQRRPSLSYAQSEAT